jgi:hypothetical protein
MPKPNNRQEEGRFSKLDANEIDKPTRLKSKREYLTEDWSREEGFQNPGGTPSGIGTERRGNL